MVKKGDAYREKMLSLEIEFPVEQTMEPLLYVGDKTWYKHFTEKRLRQIWKIARQEKPRSRIPRAAKLMGLPPNVAKGKLIGFGVMKPGDLK